MTIYWTLLPSHGHESVGFVSLGDESRRRLGASVMDRSILAELIMPMDS